MISAVYADTTEQHRNVPSKRLLVLVGHQENRRLLTQWLDQHYAVFVPHSVEALNQPFDLALLDMQALQQLIHQIKARKEADHPVFLPVILIASAEEAQRLTHQAWQVIDEVLVTPLEKAELRLRLEILLRMRQLGVDLAQSNLELKREIAERARVEQQLKAAWQAEAAARREAERTNALKSKFLAMISHELRTPLTPIKGFASTLLATDVAYSPQDQQRFIGIIHDEADRLLTLVNDLLDLTQLQAGTFKIAPEPISVPQIMAYAHVPLQALASRHDLRIEMEQPLPLVLADVERVRQVVLNIVGNAVKFTPHQKVIEVSVRALENRVQFDIADQGVGIPPQERDTIFQAFYQAATNGHYSKGAGLGLAICKGIVEAHGGKIWLGDKAEPGTLISFTLPAAPTLPPTNAESALAAT